jgi:DNA ligase D-like protein (predicted ligase)
MNAHFIEPMMALAAAELPEGPRWQCEIKFDGYRVLRLKSGGRVRLHSRRGNVFTARFESIARALTALPEETVIDGEVVALDADARPSFNVLQNHLSRHTPLVYYAFDLLVVRGEDVWSKQLDERGKLLRLVLPTHSDLIRFSETIESPTAALLDAIRAQGLEGVLAKRCDRVYETGRRSGAWIKVRVNQRQGLVIGGYTPASTTFDALLVGYYEGKKLRFAASVKNGVTPAVRDSVFRRFRSLEVEHCPFANLPDAHKGRFGQGLTAADMLKCRWLKPWLVGAMEFLEWTPANRLRHAKFVALREDKDAREVVRERR